MGRGVVLGGLLLGGALLVHLVKVALPIEFLGDLAFLAALAGDLKPCRGAATLDGRDLASEWGRGAFAYRSVAVSGYPNLFFTFGPNSGPGHSSALVYMEAQIDYITEAVTQLLENGWKALDVRAEAQERLEAHFQVFAKWMRDKAAIEPELVIREGEPAAELLATRGGTVPQTAKPTGEPEEEATATPTAPPEATAPPTQQPTAEPTRSTTSRAD